MKIKKEVFCNWISVCIALTLFFSLNLYIFGYAFNISNLMLLILCAIILFINKHNIVGSIIYICKRNPVKYFVYYFLYSIAITFLLMFVTKISFGKFLMFTIAIVFQIFLPIVLFAFLIKQYISYQKLLKIIISVFYFILAVGIFDLFVNFFDIKFLNNLISIFHTRWINSGEFAIKVFVGNIPRMQSVFDEPSHLGWLILLCSPIVYAVKIYKIKLFKNKYIENLISSTIIPLMWIDLILTFSPTMIIFTFAVNGLFYLKNWFNYVCKNIKKIIIKFIIIIILISFITFLQENVYIFDIFQDILNRINNVVSNLMDLQMLFQMEGSLGTRLCISLNDIILATKHPLGVGYGQIVKHITDQIVNSPIPITIEVMESLYKGGGYGSPSLILRILCENGFIGAFLFILYLYKHIRCLKTVLKNTEDKMTLCIARGFWGANISLIVLLSYDVFYSNTFLWLILGVGTAIYLKYYESLKQAFIIDIT